MKKFLKITFFIVIALFISSCRLSTRSRSTEEVKIYSLILNQPPMGALADEPTPSTIIIINNTYLWDGTFLDTKMLKEFGVEMETLENLRTVNKQAQIFNWKLSLNKPYEIIDVTEEETNADYAYQFSKIGFNQNLDQALVCAQNANSSGFAINTTYFLVLNNNSWEIKNYISWIP